MRVVFFGSDDFAAAHLKALLGSKKHDVVACITQPDKAKGRHLVVSPSSIKVIAQEAHIPVLQSPDLKNDEFLKALSSFDADLFIVVAYGNFLPKEVIEVPKLFCINVHASLLPKYRGAAPINWAVINGETKTGISIFALDEHMDSGDVIAQKEIAILPDDTSGSLKKRIAPIASKFLIETINTIEKGDYVFIQQDAAKVTRAPKLKKEDGLINWNDSAVKIHNRVRGLLPWPVAYTYYSGKILKIFETKVIDHNWEKFIPGEVVDISKEGLIVQTGEGTLCLNTVHPESSKPMDIKSFIAGHKIGVGFKFGL